MTATTTLKTLGAIGMLAFAVSGAHAATVITSYNSSPDLVVTGYNTSTTGSSATPWTITETLSGGGHGHLQFLADQGESPVGPGNSTGTGHGYGKWISKTITNNTSDVWTSFELELQAIFGTPSPNGDGLSFADSGGLLFSSDKFTTYTRQDVTRDYLNFSGGSVGIGQQVTFTFAITDNRINNPFWLLQTANKIDTIPEPATLALVGLALVGLGLARRKG